jgi:hypothetical protein
MLIAALLAALALCSFLGGFLFHALLAERDYWTARAELDFTAAAARGELDLGERR